MNAFTIYRKVKVPDFYSWGTVHSTKIISIQTSEYISSHKSILSLPKFSLLYDLWEGVSSVQKDDWEESETVEDGLRRPQSDSSIITLEDGQTVEYHSLFNIPPHLFHKMKQQGKIQIWESRI